jgi:CheY-like chemotaxis protein
VFYCDDSSVARKQIERTLVAMGVKGLAAVNGRQMWEEMEKVATYAQSVGKPASSIISLVLTDIEMPEMDGYILTKKIKSDPRFNGVAVSCIPSRRVCRIRNWACRSVSMSMCPNLNHNACRKPWRVAWVSTPTRLAWLDRAGAGNESRRKQESRQRRCAYRLAGSNKMEVLLFSLGTREIFGINVFKVREVGRTPHITKTPNMPRGVEGLISLRGNVIPVLSLAPFLQLDTTGGAGPR